MEPLRVSGSWVIPPEELEASFARSGGPGGQNVNKVASKVVLRFDLANSASCGEGRREKLQERLATRLTKDGVLVLHGSKYREQARNLEDTRERMAALLREALQDQKKRRATKPTRSSQRRRLDAKRRKGSRKQERRKKGED